MPSWSPDWTDVRFDHALCEYAVAALRSAAARLGETATARAGAAEDARREWRGRHRETFDAELASLQRASSELHSRLLDAVRQLGRAAEDARDEQSRREADRRRWHEEAAEERRREQLAREQDARDSPGRPVPR